MGELIKSNGGALFDKNNKPLLTDKKMIEVLEFWRELVKYAPPGWEGHGYLQTFQNLYGQKAAMMFQGYGRGAGMIEKFAPKEMANDKTFDVWVEAARARAARSRPRRSTKSRGCCSRTPRTSEGGGRVPEVLLSGRQLPRIHRDRSDPPLPDHQVAARSRRNIRTPR